MRWCLQLIGLVVGFVAAVFLAISQKPGGGIFEGKPQGGEVAYLVLKYPRLWTWGLVLFVIGFFLQLASLVCAR